METFDGLHTNRVDRILMTDTDKIFKDANQKSGVDAHFYINKVYDYYNKVHGRDSFDNYGKTISNVVHHRTDHNNAFWNGTAMYYGDGDGIKFNPLAGSLDIVAHEFTHAITDAEAGLVYQNQPGAISEHLSDAFAYFIEPDWQIGEKVYTPGTNGDALRNIMDPSISIPSQPDHMRYYLYLPNTTEGDKGGVHYNSGILNKALYNMIGEEGLPIYKVEQIYYRTITNYLTGTAKFVDLKQALIRSTRDLYTEEDAQKVKRAFDNVGIEDSI
ncbi:M4 family metallopeptidase [Macrococcus armenti]|uniref:M4 family metallopeptidase n=1 Tax=Macrococcus armenti TaxID=2875764 RepID=UPI001CCD57AA|nr:M4 family metallopeptidase [Macrococcus armenti]UBH09768.1 M4 family metallopeptidase [Macrococcus armenti]UBH12080.1 M4 family metallopeptidase [Macrococcus armenti]